MVQKTIKKEICHVANLFFMLIRIMLLHCKLGGVASGGSIHAQHIDAALQPVGGAVSYTHLDVYKRQM